ncbi:MAG TPA: hypothetical protein VKU01_04050 [Bryobacteraceae bacterium]|nr:hypothetical protein [Bryobacteraceae bacterium]
MIKRHSLTIRFAFAVALAAISLPAQDQQQPPPEPQGPPEAQAPPPSTGGGWRRFGDSPAQAAPGQLAPAQQAPAQMGPVAPSDLTIPAGNWVTVRIGQPLSSDHNQPGDVFMGTLAEPIVVNGFVVARRGQQVSGRVASVDKGGRVKGTSSLGVEITEIGLADGQQVPVHTRLIERRAGTSVGRDAAAVGTTTGLGAAIGAAVDGGFGAGMGAIGGAVVSTIGVLSTRGHATVVYPETPLTFRLEGPVAITSRTPEAFAPVQQEDYNRMPARYGNQGPGQRMYGPPAYGYAYPAYPYYGGFYPYWGPSVYFYSGPRFYRGFRRW